jgi:hypothetical protein
MRLRVRGLARCVVDGSSAAPSSMPTVACLCTRTENPGSAPADPDDRAEAARVRHTLSVLSVARQPAHRTMRTSAWQRDSITFQFQTSGEGRRRHRVAGFRRGVVVTFSVRCR